MAAAIMVLLKHWEGCSSQASSSHRTTRDGLRDVLGSHTNGATDRLAVARFAPTTIEAAKGISGWAPFTAVVAIPPKDARAEWTRSRECIQCRQENLSAHSSMSLMFSKSCRQATHGVGAQTGCRRLTDCARGRGPRQVQ
eukprot:6388217-Amphidinium_carterae.1